MVSVAPSIPVVKLKPKDKPGTGRVGSVSPLLGVAGMENHNSPMTGTHCTLTVEGCEALRSYGAIFRKGDLIKELYCAQSKQHLSSRKDWFLQGERKILPHARKRLERKKDTSVGVSSIKQHTPAAIGMF